MHVDPNFARDDLSPALPSGLSVWLPVLERLSLPAQMAGGLAHRAAVNGTDFLTELSMTGLIPEDRLYQAVAETFGVPYLPSPDTSRLMLSEAQAAMLLATPRDAQWVWHSEGGKPQTAVVAPRRFGERAAHVLMGARPHVRSRLKLTPPARLRAALVAISEPALIARACNGLHDRFPIFSARQVATAAQGAVMGVLAVVLPAALLSANDTTLLTLHIASSFVFLSCVLLRIQACMTAAPPASRPVAPAVAADAPVYTVMVALYREASIIPELLVALGRLQWPRAKLEVKLVCEADDVETLDAIGAHRLKPWVEVIRVPACEPRTKPKALAYALPFTSGEFVTLYDAEDRPHPHQLVEAWHRFRNSDDELACVQAPLTIGNPGESMMARSFAFEYAALFRGLLPSLARQGTVLPLGGTSNHFRRAALDDVGGWDPYNVTEDADLGFRLARFGYRTEMITHPTVEDAPTDISTWLPQRTRWFKGWMQTWLVLMRDPVGAARAMGLKSFLVAQILSAGMVASAMIHPFFLVSAVWFGLSLFLAPGVATFHSVMLVIDVINISLGYVTFLALGRSTLLPGEKHGYWAIVLFTPVYWLLMSIAAWRAFFQIMRRPHYWEKTPHRPKRRASPSRS